MLKRKRFFTLFLLVTAILLISWVTSAFMVDTAAVQPRHSIAPSTNTGIGRQAIPVPARILTPRLRQASDGNLSVNNDIAAGQTEWWSIDLWSTSSGSQMPSYMSGTFVAVSNTIGNLNAANGDCIIYEPINVAYGTSSSNCVWFQFVVYFFANGASPAWSIWDFPPGANGTSNTIPTIAYLPGHTYNFALTESNNYVTFSIQDVTSNTWSWSWGMTVPGGSMLYYPGGAYSPASCVEGLTTNSYLTNVPYFTTTIGYGETTHFHSNSSGIPSGIGTQVLGAPGYYSWSMLAPAPSVTATLPVGSEPELVAVTPNGAYAYVANWGSGTISVISTATNTVTSTIPVGSQPVGVAVTPNDAYAYVTNYGSGTVSVISTASNTVTATVPVGSEPYGVAVTPNGAYAYIANYGSATVSVISTASNTVTATVPVGSQPVGVAVTPNGAYAYITNGASSTVSVISTATNTVMSTISGLNSPWSVAVTPNGAYAYITNGAGTTVSVIRTATNTVTSTVSVGSQPYGVAITPNGDYAYVTNKGSGTVSVISIASNTVTATVPVGSQPIGVAVTPNDAYAYITNWGSGTLSVIITGFQIVTPTPATVDQGQTSNLASTAVTAGTSPYTYEWFVEAPGAGSYSVISGAISTSYSFVTSAITATGTWSFILQVTDSNGAAVNSTAVAVTVNSALVAPTVSASLGTVGQGQTSNLISTTVTTGTNPYTYQWLSEAPGASSYLTISGATSSAYPFTTSGSTTTGTWSFELQVTDSASNHVLVTSSATSVTVNVAPTVTVSPTSWSMDVGQSGATVHCYCFWRFWIICELSMVCKWVCSEWSDCADVQLCSGFCWFLLDYCDCF